MQKPIRWYDGVLINVYYLGLTVRTQTLTPLILPLLVQQFRVVLLQLLNQDVVLLY